VFGSSLQINCKDLMTDVCWVRFYDHYRRFRGGIEWQAGPFVAVLKVVPKSNFPIFAGASGALNQYCECDSVASRGNGCGLAQWRVACECGIHVSGGDGRNGREGTEQGL
jgi:hypothetical protein